MDWAKGQAYVFCTIHGTAESLDKSPHIRRTDGEAGWIIGII